MNYPRTLRNHPFKIGELVEIKKKINIFTEDKNG